MITPAFTPQGVDLNTLEEIRDYLTSQFQQIYGADISTDQDTPDGQLINLMSITARQLQDLAVEVLNLVDPDLTFGEYLNVVGKFWTMIRKPAQRSSVTLQITSDRQSLLLPAGFIVADNTGTKWEVLSDYTLTSGTNTVTAFSDFGLYRAAANTVTKIITPILGVNAVNNALPSIDGRDEETDEEFRLRRQRAPENLGIGTRGTLLYNLLQIPDVVDAQVYENDTSTTDANNIPPHSIWCVVKGGDRQEIFAIIARDKTAGCFRKGIQTGVYTQEIAPNKFLSTLSAFDYPRDTPLYLNMTIKSIVAGRAVDVDAVKRAIAAKQWLIGEAVVVGYIYSIVLSNISGVELYGVEISRDNTTFVTTAIAADLDEILSIPEANINITVI